MVVKQLLESICKRSRNTTIPEKLNLQPDLQMKKTRSDEKRSYIYQQEDLKEKLYPIYFLYI